MGIEVAIVSIIGALTLGTVSPGPSFVMVARTAVATSRGDGLAAALGMGIGGVVYTVAALLGLHVALAAVPWLFLVLKTLGGCYLVYLGVRIWRGANAPLDILNGDAPRGTREFTRSFWLGLGTQLSNPKTAIVYASVFAALLPREVPLFVMIVLPVVVFAIETSWYAVVVLALSSSAPRAGYLRCKVWIDRTAGGVMALLGLKLLVSTR